MKKNRKSVFVLLALSSLLLTPLSGCAKGKDLIGVSLPNQATSLNVGIGTKIKSVFEPKGYDVKVQSAEDSSTSQKQQLEAFITMGVKMLVVAPVEMGTIQETLAKARTNGIKVVVSGVNDIAEDAYDAATVSNEYLVGSYVGLLAKHWVEAKYDETSVFSTLILKSSLGADPIYRSNGMASITDEYLKDKDGNYVDAAGNKVEEASKVKNPAYCSLVAKNPVHTVQMGMSDTGKALVQEALLQDPNVRVVLMYGSLFAAGASQYVCDTYSNTDDFGMFGGGVSGNEGAYLLGSLPDGVNEKVNVGGTDYTGVKSVFRGAVSFGGDDAAQAVADLADKCFFGKEGVDYEKQTPQLIGLWFTVNNDKKEALAVSNVTSATVTDFDPLATLADSSTVIKWTKNK
jgi:ABC-type sugar transport system substrate-binding protein